MTSFSCILIQRDRQNYLITWLSLPKKGQKLYKNAFLWKLWRLSRNQWSMMIPTLDRNWFYFESFINCQSRILKFPSRLINCFVFRPTDVFKPKVCLYPKSPYRHFVQRTNAVGRCFKRFLTCWIKVGKISKLGIWMTSSGLAKERFPK